MATFTLYHVQWCPHCRAAVPEFKKLASMLRGVAEVQLQMIDCERTPVQTPRISAYPTLIYSTPYHDIEYTGPRIAMAMRDFIFQQQYK